MGFSLTVTDKNDKLFFIPEINQKKDAIIEHMRKNKKASMLYKGFFVNLVECEFVN